MDSSDSQKEQQQLLNALATLTKEYKAKFEPKEVAALLRELADEVSTPIESLSGPVRTVAGKIEVLLCFERALTLEQQLPNLLEVGGIFVDIAPAPPMLAEVALIIEGAGASSSVTLNGRVVQVTAAGVALEVYKPNEQQRELLKELPGKMRAAGPRRKLPAPADAPMPVAAPTLAQAPAAPPVVAPTPVRTLATGLYTVAGEPVKRWDLSRDSIVKVLIETSTKLGYGVIEVATDGVKRQLLIQDGHLYDIRREPATDSESVEHLLAASGRFDATAVASARELAAKQNITPGEALVALGHLPHQELAIGLRTRLLFLLTRVCALKDAQIAYYPLDQYPGTFLLQPISLLERAMELVRSHWTALSSEELRTHESSFSQFHLALIDPPPFNVSVLDLPAKEARLLEVVGERSRGLRDLYRTTSLSEQQTLTIVIVLEEMGLLRRLEVNTWGRVKTQQVEQIDLMHERLLRDNHFELLNLHWSADNEEVGAAYQAVLVRFNPDDLSASTDPALLAKIAQVRVRAGEAHQVLAARPGRATYRETVIDRFAIEGAIQMFERQLETAKIRREIRAGIEVCRRIIELDPGHSEARRDLDLLRTLI
ncbi:MAG: J domain-containing protein [Bradymonadaceae bacterium]|nr:J domain-containing protein [Lujinxingiaceae bacterium]